MTKQEETINALTLIILLTLSFCFMSSINDIKKRLDKLESPHATTQPEKGEKK